MCVIEDVMEAGILQPDQAGRGVGSTAFKMTKYSNYLAGARSYQNRISKRLPRADGTKGLDFSAAGSG